MFLEILKAILMGIVEGITEWLPISSTGHMILVEQVVKFNASEEFMSMFRVVIQLGAILAVVVLFWNKLWPFGLRHGRVCSKPAVWQLWFKVVAATIPVLIISPLDDWFETRFYNYITVAAMLILYGVLFILVENRRTAPHVTRLEQITYREAFIVGVWQMLAIIPGTSRSGATIVGGLLLVWQGVPQNMTGVPAFSRPRTVAKQLPMSLCTYLELRIRSISSSLLETMCTASICSFHTQPHT